MTTYLRAQYVYTIKADSVRLTGPDSSELIIENHTQAIPGFLFNTGRGRTRFQHGLIGVNDSTYLLGADTLRLSGSSWWAGSGVNIYNTNPGNVGIRRQSPAVTLDLPGPVNIDDTSAYRINTHLILQVGPSQIHEIEAGPVALFTNPAPDPTYVDLYAGDSSGSSSGSVYSTSIGNFAGGSSSGYYTSYGGYIAGLVTAGDDNSCFGAFAGTNNQAENSTGYNSDNVFFGLGTGGGFGGYNTSIGSGGGGDNYGSNNAYAGFVAGLENFGSYNCMLGSQAGYQQGDGVFRSSNNFFGYYSGNLSTGSNCTYIGTAAGNAATGDKNVFIGDSASWQGTSFGPRTWAVILGANSSFASGSGITLIGAGATASNNQTNATAIGYGASIQASNAMSIGNNSVQNWLFGTSNVVSGNALVVGTNGSNGNGAYLTTGGAWTNASDRNKKENFQSLNENDLLARIDLLPVTRWNYKGLHEQHIGPLAQDFYRLFRLGHDNKTISTIDPAGIALAGIQGLHSRVKDQRSQLDSLHTELQEEDQSVQMLLEQLDVLETLSRKADPGKADLCHSSSPSYQTKSVKRQ